jgi:hypothetical protein
MGAGEDEGGSPTSKITAESTAFREVYFEVTIGERLVYECPCALGIFILGGWQKAFLLAVLAAAMRRNPVTR